MKEDKMTREEKYKNVGSNNEVVKIDEIKLEVEKKVEKKVGKKAEKKVEKKSIAKEQAVTIKTKKRKLKKKYFNILIIISLIMILYGIYNLINLSKDSKEITKVSKKIEEVVIEKEIEDTDTTVIVKSAEKEKSIFWKYIKTPLINVNIHDLKNVNNDTKGWIKVGGTNINVPFTQKYDNSYYLNHDYEKKINEFGWVFADYRNKIDLTDKNLIIYGHNTADTSMFGTLRHVITNKWLNNKQNHIINMSLENTNTLWQVISVYKVNNTTDYIQTDFDDESYKKFLDLITKRSIYNFGTTVGTSDKIITLSTCSNNDTRIVLHAKLIKYDNKN